MAFDSLFRFNSAEVSQTLKLLQDIRALASTNKSEGCVLSTNQYQDQDQLHAVADRTFPALSTVQVSSSSDWLIG